MRIFLRPEFRITMSDLRILKIDPAAGISGGEVTIDCSGFEGNDPSQCAVWFGEAQADFVALGPKRAVVLVPDLKQNGQIEVVLEAAGERSAPATFTIGRKIAEDLHPVTNPAFDTDDGSLYVTRSGARGEHLPVSIFRIDMNGDVSEFSGDITNPTAIVFDQDGQMFVSSRMDGTVYRVNPFKEAMPFVRNLGVATGMAFDRDGTLYVGDRSGTIYRVNRIGEERAWVQHEPSVSAYHLAFGPDAALYLTGPTVTSFDAVYRINEDGEVAVFYKGVGRPQGLAFDEGGYLYVAASLKGRRGIVRISPDGQNAEVYVAGMNLVGLAFSSSGDMVVASNDSVYSLPLGIQGRILN